MKQSLKYALAALLAGSAAVATTAPAQAGVSFSIGIGGGGYGGYYDQDYYGYNYARPCAFYFRNDLPAPARCYRDYYSYYGPSVFLSDGFVFSNRGNYGRWRDNDRFRHWRSHNWGGSHYRGNDRGDNWNGAHDHQDNNGGHGNNDWNGAHDRQNDGGNRSNDSHNGHNDGGERGDGWNGSNDQQDGGNHGNHAQH